MTIAETVQLWLNNSKAQIISNYDRDNMRASGSFSKSLRVEILEQSGTVKGTLYGAHHSLFVDDGRGAGKQPLRSVILKWINDKNITLKDNISKDSLAFLIARKIGREGWRPKNRYPNGVISSVINNDSIKELIVSLGANVKIQVQSDIWQSFA